MSSAASSKKTTTSKTITARRRSPYATLGSYLKYLEGVDIIVELKNGTEWHGTLMDASDGMMNLTLANAHRTNNTQIHSILSLRGSTIRYIRFGDNHSSSSFLMETIRAGQDRERSALQRYKRGIRKNKN